MNYASFWNTLVKLLLWLITLAVCAVPLFMLAHLMVQGGANLSWSFLVDAPLDNGRQGGIGPLLVSTAWILSVCLLAVLSLGTPCALYLAGAKSSHSWYRRLGRVLDVLAAVPSIVIGLFGYVFFTQILGLGFSILSGGLSLACMCLPLYVRLTEHALRQVPESYRQAAEALNLSEWGYTRHIALPVAAPGIAAAVILASGRALAETAVLIFTAGYVLRMPESWFDSGRSLSVHIYDLAMNIPGGTSMAAATAVLLFLLLMLINALARAIATKYSARMLQQ